VLRARNDAPVGDDEVRALLRRRPELLREDPELLAELGLRVDAANVVDFGPVALSRAARAHRQETGARRRLEAVARANFEAQARAHQAAIALIGAHDHADLALTLDELARFGFALVAGVVALEGPGAVPQGWRTLAEGQSDLVLGEASSARLGVVPTALGLFGDRAPMIGSVAVVRLGMFSPERRGVLGFGAADETAFSVRMGHELVDFLARVVERTAERWPIL